MSYAIELKGVTKEYPNFRLNNISFQIPKGCIMGIIGENGAGKSTTIKAILGLISINSGEVIINGRKVEKKDGSIRENIGVVFDECCFPEELNIAQIEKIMKELYETWDQSQFSHYLKKFDLPPKKVVKEYSKGMKTKLSIAVALSHKAKLLILDEPTSGLDPVIREEILDVFLEFIQNEENTILLSSHITSDLEKVADYIIFVHKGELKFCNPKDEMLDTYGIAICNQEQYEKIDKELILAVRKNKFNIEILVNNRYAVAESISDIMVQKATLEEIMLFEIKGERR